MSPAFDHPWLLLLLPACLPPLLGRGWRWQPTPSTDLFPPDPLSTGLDAALRVIAAIPIAALILGLAGLHTPRQTILHTGQGAHIVIVLDRSLSMDEPFALRGEKPRETKTQAAVRELAALFARCPHDMFGLVAFSTSPIPVMPLTDHREAISAAIAAMSGRGLANTDIGGGLALGLSAFANDDPAATRILLLVSDGAGTIPDATRAYIRTTATAENAHLYYLYLRSGDDPPLAEDLGDDIDLDRPAGLDAFFRGLNIPYTGFEARDANAIEAAARRIEALPTHPITIPETIPRRDLASECFLVAAVFLALSLLAQLGEQAIGNETADERT